MDDIPEGLVEAVVQSIKKNRLNAWVSNAEIARAAILAQNAWQDDLNRRMVEFVAFRGENPRG